MVEHNPGVMMLTGVSLLTHIEPLDAPCQYQKR